MTAPADPAGAPVAIGGNATIAGAAVGINTAMIDTIVQSAQLAASPYQLRAPLPDFVGRVAEIEQLLAALRGMHMDAALALIYGRAGLGKTELALRAAHDLRDDYPDAQLFLTLGGPRQGHARSVADALRAAIRAFDRTAALSHDVETLTARYRGLLSGKRALVLLDDAPDAASAMPFLPPGGCALLVTSRARLTIGGESLATELATLARDESRALLLRVAPQLATDPALDVLLERCGDLPLLARMAGATLAGNSALSAESYLERLAAEARRLETQRDHGIDIYALLGVGADLLQNDDPILALRWRMLAACPAPFEAATAASIWGEDDSNVLEDAIATLTRRALLSYDPATNRYHSYRLLRDLAHARCSAAEAYAAHLRHAQHYLALLRAAGRLHQAGPDNVERGLALFGALQPHLATAQIWADETHTPEARRLSLDYVIAAQDLLYQELPPAEQLVRFQAALAAARAIGDRYGESRALAGSGLAKSTLGDERGAILYYKQWLAIANELGERHDESQALLNMGRAHFQLGDARSALKCYAQSLVMFRDAGERRTEGVVLSNLGDVYAALGDTRRAVESYSESLAIMQEIADHYFEAIVRWSIGELLAGQGEYLRAAQFMQALVDYTRSAGLPDAEHHATILAQVQARVKH